MKRVISYLLILIMMIPCIVLADYKYSDAVKKTDSYIFTYSDYARYIKIKEGLPYGFSNGKASAVSGFKSGGFISKAEYDISNTGPTTSWLAPGIEYWLVDKWKLDTKPTSGSDDDNSGVRITEYVLANAKVRGTGTVVDPWQFLDGFSVKIGVTDKTIGQISPEGGYEHVGSGEGPKEFILTYDNKYPIDTRACENAASAIGATFSVTNGANANTKKITVNNVSKDFTCLINFGMNCYTISLNNNNGTITNGLHGKMIYYQYGKGWFEDSTCKTPLVLSITAPTRVGYTYQGYRYRENVNDVTGKVIIGTDNKIKPGVKDSEVQTDTAYAIWIPIEYNIIYDYASGSAASGGKYPVKGIFDTTIEVTPPVRTGYTFTGWTATDLTTSTAKYGTSSTPTTSWDGTTKVTSKYFINLRSTPGTVKLTANWSPNEYTIAYDLKDGTHGTNHPDRAIYDKAFTVNNPTKRGYGFTGWKITGMDDVTHTYGSNTTTNREISSTTATSFMNLRSTSGEVKFTAQWSAITYTVKYSCNTGSGSVEPSTHVFDVAKNLNANNCTKTGYTFQGWARSSSATAKEFSDKASVSNLADTEGAEVTLYAVWKDITAPSCNAAKATNTIGSEGGVTFNITCSDNGSGCTAASTYTRTGIKSTTTFTVYDNAGNSGTCVGSVTSFNCNGYNCNPHNCNPYSVACGSHTEAYNCRTVYDWCRQCVAWTTVTYDCPPCDRGCCRPWVCVKYSTCSSQQCAHESSVKCNERTTCDYRTVTDYCTRYNTCYDTCYKTCYK